MLLFITRANPVLNLKIDTAIALGLDEETSDVDKVRYNIYIHTYVQYIRSLPSVDSQSSQFSLTLDENTLTHSLSAYLGMFPDEHFIQVWIL